MNAPSLYYTGCAAYDGKKETGYYYYSLENGTCHSICSIRLPAIQEPPERKALSLNGRLIRLNEDTYESLLQTMADSLSWTVSSLRNMTSPYIISALPYPALTHEVFHLLAGCAFLIALVDLIWLFYHSLRTAGSRCSFPVRHSRGSRILPVSNRALDSHRRKNIDRRFNHAAFPGIG